MARQKGRTIQAQIHTLFNDGVTAGLTDGQLLERFTTRRDEAGELAFAALVERHGPMVLGACRRILRDDHEAEDAFQATFLVLVLKGGSLWVHDSLGPWLHRVACRIAVRAQRTASRREEADSSVVERAADRCGGEGRDVLGRALHEEIDQLPGLYRVPVVLCDLEGRTYEDAARHLGCPVGTVKSRLARGRKRLGVQLTRRGVTFPAGFLAVSLSPNFAKASVPALLADSVVHATNQVAAGATVAGTVPASVTVLTEGMLRMMFIRRLTKWAGAVLAAGVLTVGIGVLVQQTAATPPQAVRADEATKPAPAAEIIARVANIGRNSHGKMLIRMVAIDPETAEWRTIVSNIPPGPVSPDGRYIVYSAMGPDHDEAELGIWVYDTTGAAPPRRIFEQNGYPHWSHHGQQVVISVWREDQTFETWRVNADGTGRTRLPIPETEIVLDCSPDGTWLATRKMGGEPAQKGRVVLVHPDGTGVRTLTEGAVEGDVFAMAKISPDGRSIAHVEGRAENQVRKCRLFLMDIDGTHRREVAVTLEPGSTVSPHWSPDGSRLALNAMDSHTKEGSIALVNLDGTNYRKVPLPPGTWNLHICDWKTLAPELRVQDLKELTAPPATTPRGRYEALIEEIEKTKPFEPKRYVDRFLALADSAPTDRVAVDSWIWIVTFGFDGPAFERAVDRLTEQAGTAKVGLAGLSVSNKVSPAAEKLLRAILEKNDKHTIKGLACRALGQYLKDQSERLGLIRNDPVAAKQWEAMFLEEGSTKEGFARFFAQDPDVLRREAVTILERTVREFGDVPRDDRGNTLGQEAQADLDEIHNLGPGKPAPEIEGTDADATPFKLSDFRGKVILLAFWGDWCGGGRNQHTEEKALVARMTGKPFVLLGVNSEGNRDDLKDVIAKKGLTWRSWWDGGGSANTPGPIARRYNIHAWSTFYVLDHRGIIRSKNLYPGTKKLDSMIDTLVEAAEADPGTSKEKGPG